jgi:uncharacterized membrane protein YfcA
MEAGDIVGLLAIGFAAGMLGGMIGVGGGVLMVPGLVLFLDESQLGAEATSLLAIVLVAAVGGWRQHRYGNVRMADGIAIGLLSLLGAAAGAVLANGVSERVLELSFAGVQLYFAWSLLKRATRRSQGDSLTAQ